MKIEQGMKDVAYTLCICCCYLLSIAILTWCCYTNTNPVYTAGTVVIGFGIYLLSKLTSTYSVFGLPTALLFFNLAVLTAQPMSNTFNNNTLYSVIWCLLLVYTAIHLWNMTKWTLGAIKNQTKNKEKILLKCNVCVNTALAICSLIMFVFVEISDKNLLPILLVINYIPTLTTTHMTYEPDIKDIKLVVKP